MTSLWTFGARERAKEILLDAVADGPSYSLAIWEEMQRYDISRSTAKRAKRELGIRSRRVEGFAEMGYWVMELVQ